MYLENENIRDLAGLQVQVTVMASYGIISTGVDMNAALPLTSCSRQVLVGLGVQSQSCAMVRVPG